jgi:hypothetical protein
MEKIMILSDTNEGKEASVLRYFSESGNNYLIYTFGDVNEKNHMTIYVTKVINPGTGLLGTNIVDDVEWSNVKATILRMIRETRETGKTVVNDLSTEQVKNIKIIDKRILQLAKESALLLPISNGESETPTVSAEEPMQTESVPIQEQQIESAPIQTESAEVPSVNQEQANPFINAPIEPQINNTPLNIEVEKTEPINYTNIFTNNLEPNSISAEPAKPAEAPVPSIEPTVENNDNYKELYFAEREKVNKLTEENNRLVSEMNIIKLKLSDIKNILND